MADTDNPCWVRLDILGTSPDASRPVEVGIGSDPEYITARHAYEFGVALIRAADMAASAAPDNGSSEPDS